MTTQSISETVRENAINLVQRAYAEGRINEPEMEHRLDLILAASSYQQIRLAVADLPAASQMLAQTQFPVPAQWPRKPSTDAAALIHFSGLLSGPIGPGLAWLVTDKRSATNREAAKALNYQLLSVAGFFVTSLLGLIGFGFPAFLWSIGWLALTIISAIKASKGEDWENPLTQISGFRPVKY